VPRLCAGRHGGSYLFVRVHGEASCLDTTKRDFRRLSQADTGDRHDCSRWPTCGRETLNLRRNPEYLIARQRSPRGSDRDRTGSRAVGDRGREVGIGGNLKLGSRSVERDRFC